MKGKLPSVTDGSTLGHEGVGIVDQVGDTVTTQMLLKMVQSGGVQPAKLVTHRFELADVMKAYDVSGNAAKERALKVVLKNVRAASDG